MSIFDIYVGDVLVYLGELYRVDSVSIIHRVVRCTSLKTGRFSIITTTNFHLYTRQLTLF